MESVLINIKKFGRKLVIFQKRKSKMKWNKINRELVNFMGQKMSRNWKKSTMFFFQIFLEKYYFDNDKEIYSDNSYCRIWWGILCKKCINVFWELIRKACWIYLFKKQKK